MPRYGFLLTRLRGKSSGNFPRLLPRHGALFQHGNDAVGDDFINAPAFVSHVGMAHES